jgi:hypothetical protein
MQPEEFLTAQFDQQPPAMCGKMVVVSSFRQNRQEVVQ